MLYSLSPSEGRQWASRRVAEEWGTLMPSARASTSPTRFGVPRSPAMLTTSSAQGIVRSRQQMSGLGHGLPLRRHSEHARCTPDSCRLCCVARVDSPGPIPDSRIAQIVSETISAAPPDDAAIAAQLWPRPSPARCRVRRGSVCGASSGAAHGRGACTKVAKT
jgi:hypothetical protein